MADHIIGDETELDDGERILVQIEGQEIGVFKQDGEYYAYTNWCAHQGGPCCEGSLTGTQEASYDRENLEVELDWVREDEILNCPWHGWEYDVTTGECLSRQKIQLPSYETRIEDGQIVLEV